MVGQGGVTLSYPWRRGVKDENSDVNMYGRTKAFNLMTSSELNRRLAASGVVCLARAPAARCRHRMLSEALTVDCICSTAWQHSGVHSTRKPSCTVVRARSTRAVAKPAAHRVLQQEEAQFAVRHSRYRSCPYSRGAAFQGCHPGIASTDIYNKMDTSGKLTAKARSPAICWLA
jgi:hypothetical protein